MTIPLTDEDDFRALTDKISRERGFRCSSYKDKCLRRRFAVRMRARGVHTFPDYSRLLDQDPAEYDKLLDALTINVTKLFRNADVYAGIGRHVVPGLLALDVPSVDVWSAGCSSGEEVYSLAILFHQHALASGEPSRLSRVRILGTDIDRESLVAAQNGRYPPDAFDETPEEVRRRYFSADAPHAVRPEIKALCRFERRDVITEPAPSTRFRLIVCRNVLIYFDRATQERLFVRFHEALAPGGFLVLGKVETLFGEARALFAPIDARDRIFRKA
ncbi:MAG: hypothetical protein NVS9B3_01210 [Gemmatimonadaceae bacterium]